MSASMGFKEQQAATGVDVEGIERLKLVALDAPVLAACSKERMYRPCGATCGLHPCPPGSSAVCYESKDEVPNSRELIEPAMLDFEAQYGDPYYDWGNCDSRGIAAAREHYLPPYNHIKPNNLAW